MLNNSDSVAFAVARANKYIDNIYCSILTIGDVVFFLSPNLEILEINKEVEILFLCKRSEILKRHISSVTKKYCPNQENKAPEFKPDNLVSFFNRLYLKHPQNPCLMPITWNLLKTESIFNAGYILIGNYSKTNKQHETALPTDSSNVEAKLPNAIYKEINDFLIGNRENKCIKQIIHSLVHSTPFYCHFKDAEDFKYYDLDKQSATLLGFNNPEEMIGRNVIQLSDLPKQYIHQICDYDEEVAENKQPLINKRSKPFLSADGTLVIHSLTKIPIFDLYDHLLGILTTSYDITLEQDFYSLQKFYYSLYNSRKKAHKRLLQHLGLTTNRYGYEELTPKQLQCVVELVRGKCKKSISRQMFISPNTVRTHVQEIRRKLDCNSEEAIIETLVASLKKAGVKWSL